MFMIIADEELRSGDVRECLEESDLEMRYLSDESGDIVLILM